MKALILAAGYATRLYPLTREYPKPLLEVDGRPIIDYIIEKFRDINEVDGIIIVTNSKFMPDFRKWAAALKIKKNVNLVDDLTKSLDDRRGAIGDMEFVINKKQIKDDLLVIGGDNLFDAKLNDFLSFIKTNKTNPVIGVYDIKDKEEAKKYGVLKLDAKNKVVDFQEKPTSPKSMLVAMCLYYFPKKKLNLIREYLSTKANKRDATGFYIDWLRKRESVYGFLFGGHWFDIGDPKFYDAAKEIFQMKPELMERKRT